MMARSKAKTAPAAESKGKAPAPAEAERKDNRYLRAARIIIEAGEGMDLSELAVRASMSEATASHCRDAFVGVTAALREAKLLPERRDSRKAPSAPSGAQKPPEAAGANEEREPAAA